MSTKRRIPALLLLFLFVMCCGCDRKPRRTAVVPQPTMRIVSLAPALTQMIVDLGAADLLVGVGENDDAAPEGLPTVGTYLRLDTEALLAANPTHVLMMYGKKGKSHHLAELAGRNGFELAAYPYPESIVQMSLILCESEDFASQRDPDSPPSVSVLLNRYFVGHEVGAALLRRLNRISELVNSQPRRPRVLMVINTQPLLASGDRTVLHDVLTFWLNAQNAVDNTRSSAPVLDKEMLIDDAKPDVILLLRPNDPPLGPIDEDPRLAVFRGLEIPAVKNNRITLLNDPLVHLPSTSLDDVCVAMAKAIYPELAEDIDKALTSAAERNSKASGDRLPSTGQTSNDNATSTEQPKPVNETP